MKHIIEEFIRKSIEVLQQTGEWPVFEMPVIDVSHPKSESFGDYTTNISLVLAKLIGKSPMEVAEVLRGAILRDIQDGVMAGVESILVVHPGYINISFSQKYFEGIVQKVLLEKGDFGNSSLGEGALVNNEFISANPTGPLHLGNGRGGFFGDSLTRLLRKSGFAVTNEYYVNDAGEQVMKLGHSVLKDDQAVYGGEYIDALFRRFGKDGGDVREVGDRAAKYVLEEYIKKTVTEKMRVSFDVWMSEKKLFEEGFVDKAIDVLKEKGFTFEVDGALWFRSTDFGDDKDRVLVKSDGSKTYFASDCGYIIHKMERGFTLLIEIWGADHHGYINRFKAAVQALGFEHEVSFLIVQLVKVVKDGKEVRMSKRAGNVVLIDDLIDAVGHDVTRFFFLMYAPNTHMNFDLGLAQEHSQKNPVFYVQYAHARIASIITKADEAGILVEDSITSHTDWHEKEISLVRELSLFPELLEEISKSYEVHKLPHYAIRLADKFHSFYTECKVIDEAHPEVSVARLRIVSATKIVLAETLRLIGVSAPEKM
ncbi:MAG: arginine--tRNA ligase [Candidatus Moranbacteria bacterium]|nr:arginine--tRNA ligase [Candidatus Moranbacteria bacterium]